MFQLIVAGVSAQSLDTSCAPSKAAADAGFDATDTNDANDVDVVDDAPDAAEDVVIDSYVDWCEAGPPQLLVDGGCYQYDYVPCGVPPGDTVDDAGIINRCDQICADVADNCAVLPQSWIDAFVDAGYADAATAETVEAGAVFVLCLCSGSAGRRPGGLDEPLIRAPNPLGAYFARMAHLERASIVAFDRMRRELGSLGAPRTLTAAAIRATRDEARHARVVERLAYEHGAKPPRPRYRTVKRARTIEEIARENAVEGCVRETFGALVATWQATHAGDERVKAAMRGIARDETRHAELSWKVARFLDTKLNAAARRRVAYEQSSAIAILYRELSAMPSAALVDRVGAPSTAQAQLLLDVLVERLVGTRARLRADASGRSHDQASGVSRARVGVWDEHSKPDRRGRRRERRRRSEP
jgi:hypothetical protein